MAISLPDGIPSDVPLVVKARCEEQTKRIRFAPNVAHLTFKELCRKVARALRLLDVDFALRWTDDDGEQVDIGDDDDLREALLYFIPSTPLAAHEYISMRLDVRVQASISLSDYDDSEYGGSLAGPSTKAVARRGIYPLSNKSGREANSSLSAPASKPSVNTRSASSPHPVRKGSMNQDHCENGTYQSKSSENSDIHSGNTQSLDLREDNDDAITYRSSEKNTRNVSNESGSDGIASHSALSDGWDETERAPPAGWDDGRRERCQQWSDSCRGIVGQFDSMSITITSSASSGSVHSWSAIDEMSARSSGLGAVEHRRRHGSSHLDLVTMRDEVDETNVHAGIRCKSCGMLPIIGIRYHCGSCTVTADFCETCEHSGRAVRDAPSHSASHLMVKLTVPIQGHIMAQHIHMVLQSVKTHLMQETRNLESSSAFQRNKSAEQKVNVHRSVARATSGYPDAIRCSNCNAVTGRTRFLCANCPIVTPSTKDGYSLCTNCEEMSLRCHDPRHFFIKMCQQSDRDSAPRVPLGARWEILETVGEGPLLPPLYVESDVLDRFAPPLLATQGAMTTRNRVIRVGDGIEIMHNEDGPRSVSVGALNVSSPAADGQLVPFQGANNVLRALGFNSTSTQDIELQQVRKSPARYIVPLDQVVHITVMCDNCFQLITGIWYCCCHCKPSYDLCSACEGRVVHDPGHAFAMFKQPVDMDLYKSVVDHQDAGDRVGPARALLETRLS